MRSVGPLQVTLWALLFLGSTLAIVWVAAFARSLIWLPLLPLLFAGALWSLVMLALFVARPR